MEIFNSTILNILSNFIPHKFVACDDKDPPWFNKKIMKNAAFKNYRNSSSHWFEMSFKIVAKEKYHKTENKVINKQKSSKVYWSLLKIFLKVSDKKIPIIRPLFYENRFITGFKEKTKLFYLEQSFKILIQTKPMDMIT